MRLRGGRMSEGRQPVCERPDSGSWKNGPEAPRPLKLELRRNGDPPPPPLIVPCTVATIAVANTGPALVAFALIAVVAAVI